MAIRSQSAREPIYRVMEYTAPNGFIIGWVFLTPSEYAKWKKHRQSAKHIVSGFFYIVTYSRAAEYGSMTCDRMLDYFHTTTALPSYANADENPEQRFVMAQDHPARPT